MIAWYCGIVCEGLLLARLAVSGMWRSYPLFTLWIGASFLVSLIRVVSEPWSATYRRVWVATEPALLLALVAAVAECWGASVRGVKDQWRLRWRVLGMVSVLAAGVAGPVLWLVPTDPGWFPSLQAILDARIAVLSVSLLSLAGSMGAYALFPGSLGVHPRIMLVWLVVSCASTWLLAVSGAASTRKVNAVVSLVWLCCVSAWLVLLKEPRVSEWRAGSQAHGGWFIRLLRATR